MKKRSTVIEKLENVEQVWVSVKEESLGIDSYQRTEEPFHDRNRKYNFIFNHLQNSLSLKIGNA